MIYNRRYPGIKPFEKEDHRIFFGRDDDVRSLTELVRVEKTVLLYSKSGLGKTSLINAGLIPKLEKEKKFKFIPVVIRFGNYSSEFNISPKDKIFKLLEKIFPGDPFKDYPQFKEMTISNYIKSFQFDNPSYVHILIFDQFEELFTYPEENINELKKELNELLYQATSANIREAILSLAKSKSKALTKKQLEILTSFVNIRLVFSIRSDKLSMLNRLTDYLPNLQRSFIELKPLSDDEARKAIINPANLDGDFTCPKFTFEKIAANKVIESLKSGAEQTIETFQLQLVCQHYEDKVLKESLLKISLDNLGDIKDIHQSFYDNLISEISTKSEEERERLRILLEEEFIYEPEKRRLPVFEAIILNNYKISRETLIALENTHLIRSQPYQENSSFYELIHDSLVEPILKSFYKRKEEEEKRIKEEQRERLKAEEKRKLEEEKKEIERQTREEVHNAKLKEYSDRTRRQRQYIVIISMAALISISGAIFGFYSWTNTKNALKDLEIAKSKADIAIRDFEQADSLRKIWEVKTYINDAKMFEMNGKIEDAISSTERALVIDSTNIEADSLKRYYLNILNHEQ
jgi:hypothetical protein